MSNDANRIWDAAAVERGKGTADSGTIVDSVVARLSSAHASASSVAN
jgi:hypothetical protein